MKIDDVIKKFGKSVYLTHAGGWRSIIYNAFIQPLRYKNKMYMTGEFTPIGRNSEDVYLYLGPKSPNISRGFQHFKVYDLDGNVYLIDRAEEVFFKNDIIYIWAIIRKVSEGKS